MTASARTRDVIVLGGGPAGSTTAALLAERGIDVLLLEKERFPRFHIGESLLPIDLPIFARLGIELDEGRFVRKAGAEFLDEHDGRFAEYLFADGLPGTPGHAYQVERAKFDHALLERARALGAEIREGECVLDVQTDQDRAVVTASGGAHAARFVVDATGQDAFFARRAHTVEPIRGLGIAAVFAHYDGVDDALWQRWMLTGNIKILILHEPGGAIFGWSWLIPIRERRVSFGVVTNKRGVSPELLDEVAASSPFVTQLSRGATRTTPRIIRNFSYKNVSPRGVRWATVGDSCAFLDPVFSSGVSLAMTGAVELAPLVETALRDHTEADPLATAEMEPRMRRAYDSFSTLIWSFYNTRIVDHVFFCEDPEPEMRAGLITLLASDVWREDNRFQNGLLAGRRPKAAESA